MATEERTDIAQRTEHTPNEKPLNVKESVGFPWALAGALFLLLLIAGIGIWRIVVTATSAISGASLEVMKALLQLGVVAGAGTVVSILVFEYQRKRHKLDKIEEELRRDIKDQSNRDIEDRAYCVDLIKDTMGKAISTYNSVKRCRRLMRAKALIGNVPEDRKFNSTNLKLNLEEYDKQIEALNEDQLELEALKREVGTSSRIFDNINGIYQQLEKMEKYLGNIMDEYESKRPGCVGKEADLAKFPMLLSFLYPQEDDEQGAKEADMENFKVNFSEPLRAVQTEIRNALLPEKLLEHQR